LFRLVSSSPSPPPLLSSPLILLLLLLLLGWLSFQPKGMQTFVPTCLSLI
jgi:hypothetical protein